MSIQFRKSIKLGPVRLNLSKRGVGASVGVKGFRVTRKAGGGIRTTTSIPGTGISSVKDYSPQQIAERQKSGSNRISAAFAVACAVVCIVIGVVGCSDEKSAAVSSSQQQSASVRQSTASVEPIAVPASEPQQETQPAAEPETQQAAAEAQKTAVEAQPSAEQQTESKSEPAQEPPDPEKEPEKPAKTTVELTEQRVYVAASGKGTKYHLRQGCANTEIVTMTITEAAKKGYTPCKKCAGG